MSGDGGRDEDQEVAREAIRTLARAEFVSNAIRGRIVKDGATKAGKEKAGKHKGDPGELRSAVLAHPRHGRPGQWTSVCEDVGRGQAPPLSGRQVRRILDAHHPDTKW